MDDRPTSAPRPRGLRLPFPAQAALFAVGAAALALGAGGPIPVVVWAVLAVLWWGRPVGLFSLFAAALALALAVAPSHGAAAAAPAGAEAPAVRIAPPPPEHPDPRRPADPEGVWRYGVPPAADTTALSMSTTAKAPAAPVVAATAPAAPAAPTAPSHPTAPPPPAHSSSSYKVVAVAGGGTIRGVCRLTGKPATLGTVEHFKDNEKGCGDRVQDTERVVVGEGDALANCVVYLQSIKAGKDFPDDMRGEDRTSVIDQKGCVYHPHVGVLRAKTQVVIDNSDGADHNIHGYFESTAETKFNTASAPGVRLASVEAAYLEKTGKYIVKCDIHPWMSAYLHVFAHPYYDVTSAKGAAGKKPGEFVLADVPAGDYVVLCWHEGMDEKALLVDGQIKAYNYSADVLAPPAAVHVDAGGTAVVDFSVPYQ